jgi:hypothetical protein
MPRDIWTLALYRDKELLTSVACELSQVSGWLTYFKEHPEVESDVRRFNRSTLTFCPIVERPGRTTELLTSLANRP